ncbi:hypothetical protein [Saccharopolyspora griseoalba]|uniref:Uncharacterized protein n=1 Tax=Saccharopolyspora griseoalba TaxID=1431848 RepID=A0ABW2LQM2_9PSEU
MIVVVVAMLFALVTAGGYLVYKGMCPTEHLGASRQNPYGFKCGSRNILVGKHGKVALKPGSGFDGWAHTQVFLANFSTPQRCPKVPIFSDPEFEEVLTEEHRKQRAKEMADRERLRARALGGDSGFSVALPGMNDGQPGRR